MQRVKKDGQIKGFALPTILIASVIMLTVLLGSVTTTSSISAVLKSEFYNQLAQTAADSGISYAKSCLSVNNGVAGWSDVNKLKVNTDCFGIHQTIYCPVGVSDSRCITSSNPYASFTCPDNSIDPRCLVSISLDKKIVSSFTVGAAKTTINGWRQVASSNNHTCAIAYDNKAYCWGANTYGQLGNGSKADSNIPVQIDSTGALIGKSIRSIAVGGSHTCAITYDNQAYCWGANASGQLGNTSNTDSALPVVVTNTGVLASKRVMSITAGISHTCAVASDSLAYCWGSGSYGQIGDAGGVARNAPVAVSVAGVLSGKSIRSIAAGGFHTCVVANDSLAYCWGYNANGQLGDNSTTNRTSPVAVNTAGALSGKTVRIIAANGIPDVTNNGYGHTCVIASDSLGYCWGYNAKGQIGDNSTTNRLVPTAVNVAGVLAGKTLVSISNSAQSTCSVASDGMVYCWGYNNVSQLGNGSASDSLVPVQSNRAGSPNGATAMAVISGSSSSCTIALDNKAYCWGSNSNGQLGDNTTVTKSMAVEVESSGVTGSRATSITVVGTTKLINSTGSIWRKYNQIKTLDIADKTWNQIAAGGDHVCAIDSESQANCWGLNGNGQLGDNSVTERRAPVAVTNTGVLAGKTIKAIAAGTSHTCALASDNLVYCWGLNGNGQLGDNSTTQRLVPVAVNMANGTSALYGKTVKAIAAGASHTCALASDNLVYCWGLNGNGQLGDNSITQRLVPVAVNTAGVLSGKTIISITTGASHTCVLASDSLVYCWGLNGNGQLGDASTTQQQIPVAINMANGTSALFGKFILSIAAGTSHTCAIGSDGLPYCWGLNTNGQLGDNSTTQRTAAVIVNRTVNVSALYGKFATGLSAGASHTCATASDGGAYCWGLNTNGQLGDKTNAQSLVPVNVVRSGAISNGYISSVEVENNRSCALSTAGVSYCWGRNNYGQIGNNLAVDTNEPLATQMPYRITVGL
jgi:alpha-tubulin suppressor-like RCC1 family protein